MISTRQGFHNFCFTLENLVLNFACEQRLSSKCNLQKLYYSTYVANITQFGNSLLLSMYLWIVLNHEIPSHKNLPNIGYHSQKKTFTNFVDFGMIANIFLLPFSIF